jgi:hypothetical protein
MIELSRRRRRLRKRRASRPRDWAVLSYPPNDDGPTEIYGPFTERGADPVAFNQLKRGRKVQLAPYERVRALFEVGP